MEENFEDNDDGMKENHQVNDDSMKDNYQVNDDGMKENYQVNDDGMKENYQVNVDGMKENDQVNVDGMKENDQVNDDVKDSSQSLTSVAKGFAEGYSSAHGLPNIFRATTTIGRTIWTIVFIGGVAAVLIQLFLLFDRYFDYNTATELSIIANSTLAFPAVTLCNTNKMRRSAILNSRHRQALFLDTLQPLAYYSPCLGKDFQCNNGKLCIKNYLRCDGINNCQDFSDELNCFYGDCAQDQFKCNNGSDVGYCIDSSLECNRRAECYDGEDERECDCEEDQWKCHLSGKCIARSKVCDLTNDCEDTSDEKDCPLDKTNCTNGFRCINSTKCIPQFFTCDNIYDCDNGSDEEGEICKGCSDGEFDCGEKCIPRSYVCDESEDCEDGKDELPAACKDPCHPGVSCANGLQCISPARVCDFVKDCKDNSDERNCTCRAEMVSTGQVIQDIVCADDMYAVGVLLEDVTVPDFDNTGVWLKCGRLNENIDEREAVIFNHNYRCNGPLICFNALTGFPEPCNTVYHDCYVREDSSDYRGVDSNSDCAVWEDADPPFDPANDTSPEPYLGNHNYCRNPASMRNSTYCLSRNATTGNATDVSDVLECTVTTNRSYTCHEGYLLRLRLGSGILPTEGRVEVYHNYIWGSIIDDDWNMNDADVVCRQLGFPGAKITNTTAQFGNGYGPVYMQNVECSGSEVTILDCMYASVNGDINDRQDVAVVCESSDEEPTHLRKKRQVGPTSSVGADPCSPNPCQNNGTCLITRVTSFTCNCSAPYVGAMCQIPAASVDACRPNPCLNGGKCRLCTQGRSGCTNGFKCGCGKFVGKTCQYSPNEICAPGSTGTWECGHRICLNRNVPGEPDYVCVCEDPFTMGFDCNVNSDNNFLNFCYGEHCKDRFDRFGYHLNYFETKDYPYVYGGRFRGLYLLYLPGVTDICFEFDQGAFGIASNSYLYAGPGLQLDFADLNRKTTRDGIFVFDNSQITNGRTPISFCIQSDTVWMYFHTDKSNRMPGWRLYWTVLVQEDEIYGDIRGEDYRGKVHITEYGLTCQRWTGQTSHLYTTSPDNYPESGLGDHNYCRNPSGRTGGPWCYTDDPAIVWQYCDVGPPCEDCNIENGNAFNCNDGGRVLQWQTCNKFPDCQDGSDEFDCGPKGKICSLAEEIPCRSEEKCIKSSMVCDGRKDCLLGSDEEGCSVLVCPQGYWRCTFPSRCIHQYARCNTIEDCIGGEDEDDCQEAPDNEVSPFIDPTWRAPFSDVVDNNMVLDFFEKKVYQQRRFQRVRGEDPPDWERFAAFSENADYRDLREVLKVDRHEIRTLGHQLKDFVLECTYDNTQCDLGSEFQVFESDRFGTCYTYNFHPDLDNETRYSTITGHEGGLRITLSLEQSEYTSLFGQEAGVVVSINPPDVTPLSDDEYIIIRPGVVASLGLRLEVVERLDGFFSNCIREQKNTSAIVNGSITSVIGRPYSKYVCERVCLHRTILERCHCSDTIEIDGERCQIANTTQDLCVQIVRYLHQKDAFECGCRQQCTDRLYIKTLSQSVWPSDVYVQHVLRNVHSINDKTKNLQNIEQVRGNLMQLAIYFEGLNYAHTKEVPEYGFPSLFSDIGGTIGLWVGFSVVTVLEFGILAYNLIDVCLKRNK